MPKKKPRYRFKLTVIGSPIGREVFSFDIDPDVVEPLGFYGPQVMRRNAQVCSVIIQKLKEIRNDCRRCERRMRIDGQQYQEGTAAEVRARINAHT